MILAMVPVGGTFYFKNFRQTVCRVEQRGESSIKVSEAGETSWYKGDREVEYPIPANLEPVETVGVRQPGTLDPTYWKKFI